MEQKKSLTAQKQKKKEAGSSIWTIGGEKGWYAYNWMWAFRGWVDRLLGGIGLRKGREDPKDLLIGQTLDFYRVLLADRENGHLILYAEMKMPGEMWLEWKVEEKGGWISITQVVSFRPKGVMGRFYWCLFYLPHRHIFGRLLRNIASRNKFINIDN